MPLEWKGRRCKERTILVQLALKEKGNEDGEILLMYFDAFILFKRIASELSVISRRGWRVRRREKLKSIIDCC